MIEKLKEYWTSNKPLFFLLVIPIVLGVILFALRDVIFAVLAGSARKTVDEARKTDDDLKDQAHKAELDTARAQAAAEAAAKRIAERKEEDVSEDWHLKKGKE